MSLKVSAVDKTPTGSFIDIRVILDLKKPAKMHWGGVSLILERPCDRNFPVITSEIFCEGRFESGSYSRSRSLNISPRVIPSISSRGITYQIQADVSLQELGSEPIIDLMDAKPIMLWSRPTETPRSLPANISLKGLTVQLEKDTFTPGEQIKIDLAADNIEMLQLRLIHDANVICKCPNFANICTYMHESPSKTIASANLEGVRKESRYTLKIPETAEESYFFTWQPSEQTGWYHSLESSSKYYLEIEGNNVFKEKVQVTIPIQISRPPEEKWEEPLLVHPEHGALPLSRLAMKPKKLMDIMGHEIEGTSLILRARNVADRTLEGVTVKVAGLVEEFFERFPLMIGIASWDQNEEKSLTYEKYSNEITEYQITIEDNKDAITTTKYSL